MTPYEADPHALLHCPMGPNDADADTIGEFLGVLLSTLWYENEGFSGKRPLGNSDWQHQVYQSMIEGGFIFGEVNKWGDIEPENYQEADKLIQAAIKFAYNHD